MKCVISVPLDEFAIGGVYIQNLYQHHYSPPPLIITHFIYNLYMLMNFYTPIKYFIKFLIILMSDITMVTS